MPDQAPSPDRAEVELELARIEQGHAFRSSARHRKLLRHLVQRALEGDQAALKESVIAVEVFGRPADQFDPRQDTIVRVEARRLRQRLAEHYRGSGRQAPLRIVLPVGSYVPVVRRQTPPPQASRRARDLCERGEHFLRQPLSLHSLQQALARFDAALQLSPDWAPAHVGRGRALLNLATGWYEPPGPAAAQAGAALDRALLLEPGQPVALALRAAIASQFDRDWPRARALFAQALQAAPEHAFVHAALGAHLLKHGLFDEAEQALQRARQLDPLYVNARSHMVNLRIAQRRYDEAEAELDALNDVAGPSIGSLGLQAAMALWRGRFADGVALYRRTCEALPEVPMCRLALAGALAADGRLAEADALQAQVVAEVPPDHLSPYLLAIFERWRGRPDEAFAQLERALALREPQATQVPDDPSFDALRTDPRWPSLVRRARRP